MGWLYVPFNQYNSMIEVFINPFRWLGPIRRRWSHRMSAGLPLAVALAALLLTTRASLQAAEPLDEARGTLQEWVKARQTIAKQKAGWDSDKELINQSLALYDRELKTIDEKMSQLSTNNVQVEKERLEAENLKKASDLSLQKAEEFAAQFEVQLAQLVPKLPLALQEDKQFKSLLAKLPTNRTNSNMSVTARIQTLVGLLNEIDKFNNAVTIFSGEKHKNAKGEEVAVDTVYLGLGAAYFVNDSNDFAGTGSPGAQGWEWTPKAGLGDAVREVIRIYRNERGARFVALPVEIR
jgi:hypothetical protein